MRITRKPEQERAKLRGTGTTTEQAKVLLEELDGGCWHAVSTRVGEADAEIADLMGMSADQFFQVVLLPQGEFARFLHADAGDRAKLLQRLFGTDRFHAVEDWLARRRKATADEVLQAESGIAGLLARIAQAAGVPAADTELPEDRTPWAEGLARDAAAEAEACRAQVTACRRDLDQALGRQGEVTRLADRQRRRADALGTSGQLAAAREGVAGRRAELAAAARAADVAHALAEAERTSTELVRARAAEERARCEAGAADSTPAAPTATAAALRAAGQEHVTQLGRLEALRSMSRQAADEDQAAETAAAVAAALTARIDAAGRRAGGAASGSAPSWSATATRRPGPPSGSPPTRPKPTATPAPRTTRAAWLWPGPTGAARSRPTSPRRWGTWSSSRKPRGSAACASTACAPSSRPPWSTAPPARSAARSITPSCARSAASG